MIPDNIETIKGKAFYRCTALSEVDFGTGLSEIESYAFANTGLENITLPADLEILGNYAFSSCSDLLGVYCRGNAPTEELNLFYRSELVTVYRLPEATGWGAVYAGRPVVIWNPTIQAGASMGMYTEGFGFDLAGAGTEMVVVEACTNLANGVWEPIAITNLTDGAWSFRDSGSTNYNSQYYRLSMP